VDLRVFYAKYCWVCGIVRVTYACFSKDAKRRIDFMLEPIRVQPFKLEERAGLIPQKVVKDRKEARPFSEVLKASISSVNNLQNESDRLIEKMSLGEVEDVSEVSIAVEKAELALRLMLQIRDKLLDAYQQIGRMSV
jgi:flagellar hook-basal body complex protein FliE